ncbi:MAG: ribosomal protein S18-alanine N-acetyltransferase [Proteobacteria bacterium]|nr:ribosomal protein S18-alanine N-acetyltransferase [Pseudomonadota bacterium]
MLVSDIDRVHMIEKVGHIAPWSRDVLRDCVLVGFDCRVIEIQNDKMDSVLGYMICKIDLNICHILNLCVDPEEQKKGYGRMLLNSLFDSVKHQRIKEFVLEVRPTNKVALKLYEKLGFIEEGRKIAYYKDANGIEDAIILKKII